MYLYSLTNCMCMQQISFFFFFINDPATPEIYTLSLHDALPIFDEKQKSRLRSPYSGQCQAICESLRYRRERFPRSEEHTSELQSLTNLVCRLLLEKKKRIRTQSCTCADSNMERSSMSIATFTIR